MSSTPPPTSTAQICHSPKRYTRHGKLPSATDPSTSPSPTYSSTSPFNASDISSSLQGASRSSSPSFASVPEEPAKLPLVPPLLASTDEGNGDVSSDNSSTQHRKRRRSSGDYPRILPSSYSVVSTSKPHNDQHQHQRSFTA